MMAIAKLVLVLVSMGTHMYAATPPNARPPTEQLRQLRGLEYTVPHVAMLGKIISLAWTLFETAVLLALSDICPPTLAHPILHTLRVPTALTSNPTTFTSLTPAFLVGTLLMLAGGLLRAHCFHTLGSRFTFELSIRPAHTLVTTGVYGYVRHPSYTGAVLLVLGWLFSLLDLRPWLADACDGNACHAMVTSAFAGLSVMLFGLMYTGFHIRMDKEDAMLENNFGDEWRMWAKRVPYRLVPGVY